MASLTFISSVVLALSSLLTFVSCTTIVASSPVNPVEEGGILSLHCQIRDLSDDQEVKIIRVVGGRTQRLSADKDIKSEAGDRFFLAIRQMNDGTTVYFLSIMDVAREDGGNYFCQVVREGALSVEVAAIDSVEIGIMHFPDETEPICESNRPTHIPIRAGTPMVFNCTSSKSNPPVDIRWSRTGTKTDVPKSISGTGTERLYSFIRFTPTVSDNDAIFLCQISSPYFPGKVQTCHVGPLKVLPNKNLLDVPTTKSTVSPKREIQNREPSGQVPAVEAAATNCEAMCTTLSTPIIYWVVATIAASVLSLIFLVVGMVLLIKMCNLRSSLATDSVDYACAQPIHDKIYVELETNKKHHTHDKLYMSLAKRERPLTPTMFTTGNTTLENTVSGPVQGYILQ